VSELEISPYPQELPETGIARFGQKDGAPDYSRIVFEGADLARNYQAMLVLDDLAGWSDAQERRRRVWMLTRIEETGRARAGLMIRAYREVIAMKRKQYEERENAKVRQS
jgi:hypothetical protein